MVDGLKERDKLRTTFGKYMTAAVMDHLLAGKVSLGGESLDGKTLYFVKNGGVWKMPVSGGESQQVVSDVYRNNFALTEKGIYFTPKYGRDGISSVEFYDFAAGKTTQIVKILKPVDLGLGVSPDGRTLLYSQVDYEGSNLLLVENFH